MSRKSISNYFFIIYSYHLCVAATFIRDDYRVVDQDRILTGRSRDDNRPIDQYRARAERSSIDHRAIDQENMHAERRQIPQSSTYSMQDGIETNTYVKHFVDKHLFSESACCDKNNQSWIMKKLNEVLIT